MPSLPSYRPFCHFVILESLVVFAVAMFPCWTLPNGHFGWFDAACVFVGVIAAGSLFLLYGKWAESDLYWNFCLTRWADCLGILTCLVQLGALMYSAWRVSGLAWFHLSAREHFIFALVMLFLGALWLIEAIVNLIKTEIDIRRIMRIPADLLPTRGGWYE